MKFKSILATVLVAAAAFTGCSKDENGSKDQADGARATLDMIISFPEAMATRAVDGNASAQDVKISEVTVFIFNTDGTHAKNSPAHFNNPATQFTDNGNNKYSLKEGNRIETTAGTKKIYVGINLPTALANAASESVLIEEAEAANLFSDSDVAMLSIGKTEKLAAQEVGSTPTVNKVELTVTRLVAKLAVSAGSAADYSLTAGSSSFKVKPDQFGVGNTATHFYPVQRIAGNKLVTPMKSNSTPSALKVLNANGTAANMLTSSYYVPEHSTSLANKRGEATYAVVRGELTFTKYAKVVSGVIEFSGDATGHTGDIYVVRKGSDAYFCASADDQDEVYAAAGIGAEKQTYKEASGKYYTFYHVFINVTKEDKLAVYRNQFINICVTGVNGIGTPGDPSDPSQPDEIDNKEEPAIETDAYLEVIVDVAAWDYDVVNTILQ